MRLSAILLFAAALVSCVDSQNVALPELGEDATSAIVIIEYETKTHAYALDIQDGALQMPYSAHEPAPNILMLLYDRSLVSMFLQPGLLPAASSPPDANDRPPPIPIRAIYGEASASFAALSEEAALASTAYQRTRIKVISPRECLASFGCYSDQAEPYCVRPCPAQQEAPAAIRPVPPELDCLFGVRNAFVDDDARIKKIAPALASMKTCEPGPVPHCPSDQLWHMGLETCEAVTTSCPLGQYPDGLPPDAIRVNAGESLSLAIAAAPPGATIALTASEYPESLSIDKDLILRGACGETRLGTIEIFAGNVELRELTVGTRVQVMAGAGLHLEKVIVADGEGVGLSLAGSATIAHSRIGARSVSIFGDAQMRSLVVRNSMIAGDRGFGTQLMGGHTTIRDSAFIGRLDNGAISAFGGDVDISRTIVELSSYAAIQASEGSVINVDHSLVRNIQRTALFAIKDGAIYARTSVFQGVDGPAMVADERGHIDGRDLWFQTLTSGGASNDGAVGRFYHGASVRLERVVATDSALEGLMFSRRSSGELIDVSLLRTGDEDHDVLVVREEAQVVAARIYIAGARGRGVYVKGNDLPISTQLDLTHATLVEGERGGIEVVDRGSANLDYVTIGESTGFGLSAYQPGAEITALNLWVRGLKGLELEECKWNCAGVGVHSGNDGRIEVDGFVIETVARGARVAASGALDLLRGRFAQSPHAVLADDDSYDLRRLFISVDTRDIEEPIEANE
jgi:hypothetical protein